MKEKRREEKSGEVNRREEKVLTRREREKERERCERDADDRAREIYMYIYR